MFWSVWGASPAAVSRGTLAGGDRRALADIKLVYPAALALDPATRTLYWADTYLECVERADYDGRNRHTVRRGYSVSGPARPVPRSPAPPLTVPPADGVVALRVQTQKLQHISVLEETLYLPVWSESSVAAVSRYSRDSRRTDISLSARPSAVLVYHRQRQPAAAHPCGVSGVPGVPGVLGAGCDHICVGEPVPAPGGGLRARCLCRHGYRLAGHGSCLREYTLRRGTEPRLRWGHTATPGTCVLQAWSWTRTWWWHAGCRRWCRRCRWRRKTRRGSGKARRRR